ncbi:MAG: hypothetical protein KDD41_02655 [Flavobacteriales bacterium]|nr:hypothetical protein [Flavobacteriales bacterium]
MFLFCLLLASFFWVLNALSNKFTTDVTFKANYINAPKDKVVLNELPKVFGIRVRGLGFDLLAYKMSFGKPEINIDLSKLKQFNNQKDVSTHTISSKAFVPVISEQLGDQLEIRSITPNTVYFVFDKRAEKVVEILPVTQLNFKQQYKQFGSIEVKPSITTVTGPASIVDTLNAVYTEKLILNNLFETVTATVGFSGDYQQQHLTFIPEKALLHIPVEKFTETSRKVVIDYVNVPEGVELKAVPSEIELKFLLPLSKMASLASARFKAEVDYVQVNDHFNQKLKVNLVQYPDFIQIVSQDPLKVEYIIKKK